MDRELATRHLREFIAQAWTVVEPATQFVPGWHIDAMCDHLEAIERGQIQNLLINVPPGHMKSLIVSVFWPAWSWARNPAMRWLFASYAATLSIRDSVKCRRVIESEWYQSAWGHVFRLTGDQNQKTKFENNKTGSRTATSVGGAATGERANRIIADDPHNLAEVHSDKKRTEVLEWWDNVMFNRVHDPERGARVIVMQRGHSVDLSGHVLKQDGWEHLCLPAEYEPTARISRIGWSDPRSASGAPLWPERFGANGEHYHKLKAINRGPLDSYSYAAQYQQRPAPASGGIWKTRWWRFWCERGEVRPPVRIRLDDGETVECPVRQIPDAFDDEIQSWDMTFKGLETSKGGKPDYVVGGSLARSGADCYLRDVTRGQWEFFETIQQLVRFSEAWPETRAKLVEDKANGPAIISTLSHKIPGLIAVEPDGDKAARARAVAHMIEAGNVYLPHPDLAPWVWGFIHECSTFPSGENDDQVDMLSQALRRWSTSTGASYDLSALNDPVAGLLPAASSGFSFGAWRR